jgi:rare lipoprotein A
MFYLPATYTTAGFKAIKNGDPVEIKAAVKAKVLYGTASYYADKFGGRTTANGATYSHTKLTAACNVLPLNTWIRVTNLRNSKAVIVQVNDRLHPKNKRIVDMSRMAATQLGYIGRGLTQVKVEVLEARKTKK